VTAVEQARGLAGRIVLLLSASFSLVRRRLLCVPVVVRAVMFIAVISKEPSALARAALFRRFSSFVRDVHADSAARWLPSERKERDAGPRLGVAAVPCSYKRLRRSVVVGSSYRRCCQKSRR
jgi:hypothetical protein